MCIRDRCITVELNIKQWNECILYIRIIIYVVFLEIWFKSRNRYWVLNTVRDIIPDQGPRYTYHFPTIVFKITMSCKKGVCIKGSSRIRRILGNNKETWLDPRSLVKKTKTKTKTKRKTKKYAKHFAYWRQPNQKIAISR